LHLARTSMTNHCKCAICRENTVSVSQYQRRPPTTALPASSPCAQIAAGAHLDVADFEGLLPLHQAACTGNVDLAKLLVRQPSCAAHAIVVGGIIGCAVFRMIVGWARIVCKAYLDVFLGSFSLRDLLGTVYTYVVWAKVLIISVCCVLRLLL